MPNISRYALLSALTAFGLSAVSASPAFASRAPAAVEDTSFYPSSVSGAFLAARLAASLREDEKAATFYAAAAKANPRNIDLVNRSFIALVSAGEVDKAVPFAQRVLKIDRNNSVARLVLGVRALRNRNYSEARAMLAPTTDKPVLQLATPLMITWSYAGAGQTRKGVAAADAISSDEAFGTFKNFSSGMMLDMAGMHEEAIARLKSAYERDSNATSIAEAYMRALARAGKKDEALAIAGDYLVRLPRQPVITALADDIRAGRQIDPAIRTSQEGVASILMAVASAVNKQGAGDFAVVFYRLALYLAPDNANAMIDLADVYNGFKQPGMARALLEGVPPTSPLKRNAEIGLALALDDLGRPEDAIAHLKALIEKNPADIDTLVMLGGLYQNLKRWDEVIAIISQALEKAGPPARNQWGMYYTRGIAYERTKQWPKAEADFKKSLELLPDQPSVLNYLGYSWIDQGINLKEGMELIRKAVDQSPDDGYIVDSLGWAHYMLGDYNEAVEQLERAVALRPGDATVNDHLGDAYWKAGRRLEATFQWRHALDSRPEPEQKAAIEIKMKQGLKDTPAKSDAPKSETIKSAEPGKPVVNEQPKPETAPQKSQTDPAPAKPATPGNGQ